MRVGRVIETVILFVLIAVIAVLTFPRSDETRRTSRESVILCLMSPRKQSVIERATRALREIRVAAKARPSRTPEEKAARAIATKRIVEQVYRMSEEQLLQLEEVLLLVADEPDRYELVWDDGDLPKAVEKEYGNHVYKAPQTDQ